jgi:hypothetical protein
MITPGGAATAEDRRKERSTMAQYLRLARPYFVLLAIFATGRWLMGTVFAQPYDRGNPVFSIITLTALSAVFYGAFGRRWRGFSAWQAATMGFLLGLASQVVILLATVLSYSLDLQTYFNHPIALNAPGPLPFSRAVLTRLGGLIANPISAGIIGALGWAFGGLLPEK